MYRNLVSFFVILFMSSCGNLQKGFEQLFAERSDLKKVDLAPSLPVRTLSADTRTWNDVVTNSAEILAAEISVIDAKQEIEIIQSTKGLQLNSNLQAGSMSILDSKNGLLGTLNADQLLSDFGQTNAKLLQAEANVELAKLNYLNVVENQLLTAALAFSAWEVGLELMDLTYSKQVLAEPIIENLRKLSFAGQIDSIQLATAEQSFAQLEITKLRAMEAVKKAEITLAKFFNASPAELNVEFSDFDEFTNGLEQFNLMKSLQYRIAQQRRVLADINLLAHKVSDRGSVVARSKLDVPVADNMAADASVGIIYSKTLRDGGRYDKIKNQLEAKIRLAEADMLNVTAETKSRNDDLRTMKTIAKSSNELRLDLIANVEDQISQLENQLAIGSTSFNELLSSHMELYQLQREEIEAVSELRRINLEIAALNGELLNFLKVDLPMDNLE